MVSSMMLQTKSIASQLIAFNNARTMVLHFWLVWAEWSLPQRDLQFRYIHLVLTSLMYRCWHSFAPIVNYVSFCLTLDGCCWACGVVYAPGPKMPLGGVRSKWRASITTVGDTVCGTPYHKRWRMVKKFWSFDTGWVVVNMLCTVCLLLTTDDRGNSKYVAMGRGEYEYSPQVPTYFFNEGHWKTGVYRLCNLENFRSSFEKVATSS